MKLYKNPYLVALEEVEAGPKLPSGGSGNGATSGGVKDEADVWCANAPHVTKAKMPHVV